MIALADEHFVVVPARASPSVPSVHRTIPRRLASDPRGRSSNESTSARASPEAFGSSGLTPSPGAIAPRTAHPSHDARPPGPSTRTERRSPADREVGRRAGVRRLFARGFVVGACHCSQRIAQRRRAVTIIITADGATGGAGVVSTAVESEFVDDPPRMSDLGCGGDVAAAEPPEAFVEGAERRARLEFPYPRGSLALTAPVASNTSRTMR